MNTPTKKLPQIGIFACFSGGSNSGSITGLAALEVAKRLGTERVGVCSLPAILNQVPRQVALVKAIEKIIIIDGCHNGCARQLLRNVGIEPTIYINLEENLGITKQGPFSGSDYTEQEVQTAIDALIAAVSTLTEPNLTPPFP